MNADNWCGFGILLIFGLVLIVISSYAMWSMHQPQMCSMSIGVKGDLNSERLGLSEFISNMKIDGIEVTAPCGSDGIVDLYNLQYGVN